MITLSLALITVTNGLEISIKSKNRGLRNKLRVFYIKFRKNIKQQQAKPHLISNFRKHMQEPNTNLVYIWIC